MDLTSALLARKSHRAFLDKPVPVELIKEVLKIATNAPSGSNFQPWDIYLTYGSKMKELINLFRENKDKGERDYSPGYSGKVPMKFKKRTNELFKGLKPYLKEAGLNNNYIMNGSFEYFNAPSSLFLFMDKSLYPSRAMCIGSFMTYFTLTAHAKGLGTCLILYVRGLEDIIRSFFEVPDNLKFMVSIALGYPDDKHPVNKFKSGRVSVDEVLKIKA